MYGLYIYENQAGEIGYNTDENASRLLVDGRLLVLDGRWELVEILNRRGDLEDLADYFSGEELAVTTELLGAVVAREEARVNRESIEYRERLEAAEVAREQEAARHVRQIEKMNRDMATMARILARYV